MKIKLLSSSVDQERSQFAASYVINESVAIDSAVLDFSSLSQQRRIRHVVLSHSHLDYIGSLPIFLDNVYVPGPDCPVVYASPQVIDCLRGDFFNERVWPDMVRLSGGGAVHTLLH